MATQITNRGVKMLPLSPVLDRTPQDVTEIPALAALALRRDAASHPRMGEFRQWMQQAKGGARTCPRGGFPDNFLFWLDGGRW